MTLTEEFTHKYVAILRCRTWGEWPEWNRFFLPAYEEPLPLPDGRRLLLSIHVATYAKRDRPEATPCQAPGEGGADGGPRPNGAGLWDGKPVLEGSRGGV